MWDSEKQNKTNTKLKNTPKYLQQSRALLSQPSHLCVTFCRTVHIRSSETKALCYGTRPFGRRGWHEFSVRVKVVLPRLSLGSCCASVNELKQHLLRHRILDAVADSHGSAVGIWKAFVYPLSHEDPAVVLKLALYNFVVILFEFFCHLYKKTLFRINRF